MKLISLVPILLLYLAEISQVYAQISAFPGAEGFGAHASGGRGGAVYEVTTLKDGGSGSLREGVKKSKCSIVFRVSGYIHLNSELKISGNALTIAGQTAPGDGICVRGYPTSIRADNVIIRYMRFRLGDEHNLKSDAFNINKRKNIIIDHCSFSWGVDECASWYSNENVTIQWCMIGEGLDYKGHTMGGLWGGQSSYHHNLIYSCGTRHPKFAYTYDPEITDHRNNVIYNWRDESAYTSPTGRVNIIANYYKYGPSTKNSVKNHIVFSEYATKRLYVKDNYVYGFPEVTADNWKGGGVTGKPIRHDTPFPAPAVATQTAQDAYQSVLKHAGASLVRDGVDKRIVEEVKSGKGKIINRQKDVGGFPKLSSKKALLDSDHDGMPDIWEKAHNLNPQDASDRNKIGKSKYTNLEIYLNSINNPAATVLSVEKQPLAEGLILKAQRTRREIEIFYAVPVAGYVRIEILNSIGQNVAVLVNENKSAGKHKISLSTSRLPMGIYFYRFKMADSFSMVTRNMIY